MHTDIGFQFKDVYIRYIVGLSLSFTLPLSPFEQ